jgi:hypothetical protein
MEGMEIILLAAAAAACLIGADAACPAMGEYIHLEELG